VSDSGNVLPHPLEQEDLFEFLPHRPPFLFLRRLTAWTPGTSAVGEARFDADEFFFRGHFPGNPIVPGVILTEVAAQTGGFALTLQDRTDVQAVAWLAKIRHMRFRAVVRPDETLTIRAEVESRLGPGGTVAVSISRGETAVAEGELVISLGSGG